MGVRTSTAPFKNAPSSMLMRYAARFPVSEPPLRISTRSAQSRLPQTSPPAETKPQWRRWLWPTLAASGVLAVLAVAYWHWRRPLPPPRITDYAAVTFDGRHKLLVGTDGNRLYLNVYDRSLGPAQVPISGGQISSFHVDLPSGMYGFGPQLEDVSPDGSSLLVFDHQDSNGVGDIWIVGSQGHPARYLIRASHAAWSPDGKTIVFSGAFGDFHLIPSEGGETRLLVNVPQQKAAAGLSTATPHWLPEGIPQWSPDGRAIRFTWNESIWEVSSDGANLHQLLPNWRPSFFKCCGSGRITDIYVSHLSREKHEVSGRTLESVLVSIWIFCSASMLGFLLR